MTAPIDIVKDALLDIGEIAPGESVGDARSEYSLRTLNDMIEQWNNEDLTLFAFLTQTFSLQSNKSDYTVGGTSPDISGPRPLKIHDMFLQDNTGNRIGVNLRTLSDFISLRNRLVTSQIPSDAYYDPQFPQAVISFWPTPLDPLYDVFFTSYLQLSGFPDLFTDIELPAGYRPALRYNLAMNIASGFGKTPSETIARLAGLTLGSLKRTNMIVQTAHYDRALTRGSRGASYNIFSDGYGPRTG